MADIEIGTNVDLKLTTLFLAFLSEIYIQTDRHRIGFVFSLKNSIKSVSLSCYFIMEQNSTVSPFDFAQQKPMADGDAASVTNDNYHLSTRVNREHGHFRQLFWRNKHATVTYCMVFWAFGMCVAFLGPTLWDLGCQTGTTIDSMTWVFLAQSLFILIGSMTGGVMLQR